MWKTFIAELRYIFLGNRWRGWEWLFIAIIPFLYGFFYMNAYWDPFGKTEQLRVAIVNLDDTSDNENLINAIKLDGKNGVQAGTRSYKFNIEDATKIYNVKTEVAAKNLVEDDKYQAVIIIDKDYTKHSIAIKAKMVAAMGTALVDSIIHDKVDLNNIADTINGLFKDQKGQLITFYNSVKYNYLAGEMTNFGAGLSALEIRTALPNVQEIKDEVAKQIAASGISITMPADIESSVNGLLDILTLKNAKSNIMNDDRAIGKNVNTYGFGLAPYFVCIALWAGALVMIFLFKNERHINDQRTIKHYFGKSMIWVGTGWIQAIILSLAITAQGVDFGSNQWMLFVIAIFISTIFTLTVQGVSFLFRYGDFGEFAAVLLLVLQLVSASGTFPVDMQAGIFKVVHPIIPFTYAIAGLREAMYMPDASVIAQNFAIILIFPAVAMSLSLLVNWRFDMKTRIKVPKGYEYQSFEIHLNDH